LRPLHPLAFDGEGGIEQRPEQQAVEERKHQPAGVLTRLVAAQPKQGRDFRPGTAEARGQDLSDAWVVLRFGESAEEVPGQARPPWSCGWLSAGAAERVPPRPTR
jgi:hypothetical protein